MEVIAAILERFQPVISELEINSIYKDADPEAVQESLNCLLTSSVVRRCLELFDGWPNALIAKTRCSRALMSSPEIVQTRGFIDGFRGASERLSYQDAERALYDVSFSIGMVVRKMGVLPPL
jgi:hypothetical protein